jgi:hypothetical protein
MEIVANQFNLDAIPILYRTDVVNAAFEALLEPSLRRSDCCRLMFSDKRLRVFRELPQATIAQFLRVSDSVVSQCRHQAEAAQSSSSEPHYGRPTIIPDADEQGVLEWIRSRTLANDWPTLREVKEQILHRLELSNPDATPSKSYYTRFIQRVLGDEFVIRTASPLEEDRYRVSADQIVTHFEGLKHGDIASISPHLILNTDETGFGASKSGRAKSRKVIVPARFEGTPVYKETTESHFITSLCAISAAGDVLRPGFISKRETDHHDSTFCHFPAHVRRYSSLKAFVTARIFNDYLTTVVLPYITEWRKRLGEEAPAMLIFDGHKAHLCQVLGPWAAMHHILLVVLPPHTSHLLQPLDQGFFRRLKTQYSVFQRIPELSKISSSLERIWMAFQATTITRLICNSWKHAGIVPVIENGECIRCELDSQRVLRDPALRTVVGGSEPIWEGARGNRVSTGEFGLLNEDEMLIMEAGQCPFCCQPLDD